MAFGWIDEQAEARRRAGLVRTLRPRPADSPLLDLASNDYLGLARHPEVTEGAARAARRWGGGATGSRLVTGSTELHAELERELADFCGFEAALVFSSGYAANLAAVTALAPHGSLVVSDAGNHASLIDGCRLARGTTQVVGHADPDAVRKALGTHTGPAVAVSDTVFSVDGDAAPLAELAAACRESGAGMIVDDAHGLGVLGEGGRGSAYVAGLAGAPDVVVTVTLSKSLGSQGCGAGPRPGDRAPRQRGPYVHLRHGPRPRGGGRGPRGPHVVAPGARTGRTGACGGARSAHPADGSGTGGGTAGRGCRLRARAVSGGCRAMGGRLPGRRSGRGLLPPAVRARRSVPAAADRPRGPGRGTDRAGGTGDRREPTVDA